MRLNPAEGHALVLEARVEIAERGIVRELGSRKETNRVQAIVDGSDDDVGRLVNPVVEWPVSRVSVHIPCQVERG